MVVTLPIAATSPLLARSIVDWSRVVDVAEDPDRTSAENASADEQPERTKSATRTEDFCVRCIARSLLLVRLLPNDPPVFCAQLFFCAAKKNTAAGFCLIVALHISQQAECISTLSFSKL